MGIGIAGPALTAAVSNARGLGVLGVGGLTPAIIEELVIETKRLTSRAFGVNIILPLVQGHEIETCFDLRVPMMVLFWGDVYPYIKDAHRRDILVVAQCGSAEEASEAADAGVDGSIIQGTEAGGHVKATSPLDTTLAETIKTVGPLPVIAAGGIATGKDIANALLSGASAVSMGTRFLATEEAVVTEQYKRRVVESQASDTVLTKLFDMGWPDAQHRIIRNNTYRAWESDNKPDSGSRPREHETIGYVTQDTGKTELPSYTIFPPLPNVDADPEELALYAGESCERIGKILRTKELMTQLHDELREAMS